MNHRQIGLIAEQEVLSRQGFARSQARVSVTIVRTAYSYDDDVRTTNTFFPLRAMFTTIPRRQIAKVTHARSPRH